LELILTFVFTIWLTGSLRSASAQDDWVVVDHSGDAVTSSRRASGQNATSAALSVPTESLLAKPFFICGERAIEASPEIAAIVDRINALWGVNFRAYQTIAVEQPHAATGGCVFYNAQAMAMILTSRLNVRDTSMVDPLVWAIFAHEMGHQYHRDTDSTRASVPTEIKELEADRFAGYTLEKLNIRATDLTPYWNLTGDEFGGGGSSANRHGTSAERVAAFKQGWHLAEWNRPEDSGSVLEAQNEAVAPEDSEAAPK
jgi:hypothetical protein